MDEKKKELEQAPHKVFIGVLAIAALMALGIFMMLLSPRVFAS